MIIFIGGSKGGVGKSLVSMLALNHYIKSNIEPILIETDTSNPDVYKAYTSNGNGKNCIAYGKNIDTDQGWEKMLDVIGENIEKNSNIPIIINSAARNNIAISNHGDVLNQLGVDFTTFWVINNQFDSLMLMKEYIQTIKQKICVVKNGFFAAEEDFTAFNNSKYKKSGIPNVYLPKATEAITDALYTKRLAIHELNDKLSFGERMLASSWITKATKVLTEAIETATLFEDHKKNEGGQE